MSFKRTEHILITGGNGYIGARLAEIALQQGRQVVLLGRAQPQSSADCLFAAWNLGEPLPAALTNSAGKSALIHLAHDWKNTPGPGGEEGHLNVTGTQTLYQSSRAAGIDRFIFVSSQSARQDSLNIYGRVKFRIEQEIAGADSVSARVGLVYGGAKKAMFGLLCALVSKLPLIPMICPHQQVQPIHLDEVCQGLLLLADSDLTGWKGLAGPEPVTFGGVLRLLAREAYGRHIPIIPVPLTLALWGARLTSYIPFIPTVDKERILGLAGTRFTPCAADLREMGLEVVPMTTGLRQGPWGRKALLAEGRTLLHYVLGHPPSAALQKRYLKAVRLTAPDAGALGFFPLFIAFPALLRLIEPLNPQRKLAQRIRLAAALTDASAEGMHKLLQPGRGPRLIKTALTVLIDIAVLPVRLLAGACSHD